MRDVVLGCRASWDILVKELVNASNIQQIALFKS